MEEAAEASAAAAIREGFAYSLLEFSTGALQVFDPDVHITRAKKVVRLTCR